VIIVKQDFSDADIRKANLAATEFRASKTTSRVANLSDQVDLGKVVILCEDHVRQFASPQVLRKYGYRQMIDYPHVMGNCDYCKVFGKSQMYMREDVFAQSWRTKEQKRRDLEYSTIVSG
jgi:hypothetical protein